MKQLVCVTINGQRYREEVDPRMLLSFFLREQVGLTGTHIGCIVGECGACSVLLEGQLVKSCLVLAVRVHEKEIVTVEGLATEGTLHPIQEAFVEHYALQCGYCTSGMVLAGHHLLTKNPNASEKEIRQGLAGNLCMCTGYTQIIKAVTAAGKEYKKG
ncbi:MAG: (2Fe-2S)-binding protein [Acidobacteriota bacterium]|nr:(2Fe-2S)-binding protein [Acidobacteriota bacterium]